VSVVRFRPWAPTSCSELRRFSRELNPFSIADRASAYRSPPPVFRSSDASSLSHRTDARQRPQERAGVLAQQIASDLTIEREYRVAPQVLDAADFGVPQTRKRLLFIGLRRDLRATPPVLAGTGATESVFLERDASRGCKRYRVTVHAGELGMRRLEALSDSGDASVVSALGSPNGRRFVLPSANRTSYTW
jgi:C-5 cytosine-specific DNA methylase